MRLAASVDIALGYFVQPLQPKLLLLNTPPRRVRGPGWFSKNLKSEKKSWLYHNLQRILYCDPKRIVWTHTEVPLALVLEHFPAKTSQRPGCLHELAPPTNTCLTKSVPSAPIQRIVVATVGRELGLQPDGWIWEIYWLADLPPAPHGGVI